MNVLRCWTPMRRFGGCAGLAVLVALAASPGVAAAPAPEPAEGPELRFALPASGGPELDAAGATWALLVFDDASATGHADLGATAWTAGHTWRREVHGTPAGVAKVPHTTLAVPRSVDVDAAALASTGKASLLVLADRVDLRVAGSPGATLLGTRPGEGVTFYTPNDLELESAADYDAMSVPGSTGVLSPGGGSATLQATGVREVRTHGIAFGCSPCPDGNDRTESSQPSPAGQVEQKDLTFHELRVSNGTLAIAGPARFVMLGGDALDLTVRGEVRLPLATGAQACDGCIAPRDQTLTASGTIHLAGLRAHDASSASARVGGAILAARLDETRIDPAVLWGGTGVAAVALGVAVVAAVKALLVPLFTRLGRQEALEHPKRSAIYQYIQEHPGANFREVARNTGIAAGTVRHHLTVLERAGHIVEHQHEGTVRLFENHGKFDHNWADVVLLREAALAQLHAWIKANPASPQKAVLEGMERDGWSRSTTQHRLARLVEGGLVAVRLQGRLKIYSAVDRSKPLVASFGLARTSLAVPQA